VNVDSAAALTPVIAAQLRRAGVDVREVTAAAPSMEDVFIEFMGAAGDNRHE